MDAETTGLEVQVHIEVHVAISFGLEIFASVFGSISTAMEVIMENSFAIVAQFMACVWCGIAFLRSLWREKIPTQARGLRVWMCDACQE